MDPNQNKMAFVDLDRMSVTGFNREKLATMRAMARDTIKFVDMVIGPEEEGEESQPDEDGRTDLTAADAGHEQDPLEKQGKGTNEDKVSPQVPGAKDKEPLDLVSGYLKRSRSSGEHRALEKICFLKNNDTSTFVQASGNAPSVPTFARFVKRMQQST